MSLLYGCFNHFYGDTKMKQRLVNIAAEALQELEHKTDVQEASRAAQEAVADIKVGRYNSAVRACNYILYSLHAVDEDCRKLAKEARCHLEE